MTQPHEPAGRVAPLRPMTDAEAEEVRVWMDLLAEEEDLRRRCPSEYRLPQPEPVIVDTAFDGQQRALAVSGLVRKHRTSMRWVAFTFGGDEVLWHDEFIHPAPETLCPNCGGSGRVPLTTAPSPSTRSKGDPQP